MSGKECCKTEGKSALEGKQERKTACKEEKPQNSRKRQKEKSERAQGEKQESKRESIRWHEKARREGKCTSEFLRVKA